jgi:hypothetical protein
MAAEFNTNYWPMVYIKLSEENLNDQIFEEYQKNYLNLLIRCKKNNEKMVIITNLTNLTNKNNISMKYMMKQLKFSNKINEFNKKYVKLVIILCHSKSLKSLINTVFSFIKPAAPYKLFINSEKANSYLLDNYSINFDINVYDKISEVEEESDENIIEKIDLMNINEEDDQKKIFTEYFNQLK